MTRIARRLAVPAVAAAISLLMLPGTSRAQTPLYFPVTSRIDTTQYTMRVFGNDRYATAGALARVSAQNLSTNTGYPYNQPNATLDVTSYGFSACPKAVGIAAGDTVADALAASSMKDLTLLRFGLETVDTSNAVMLLTGAGRQGVSDLNKDTLTTLTDLRDVCGTFDALVFGSENAVPQGALEAVNAIASNVVRVSGTDRFDTARSIAVAVNAARGPADIDFYATANTPTAMKNVVFLAESATGADALAVGPFAAGKNVPIVLVGGTSLPAASRNALLAIHPANIIVLGGPAAVSEDMVKQATDAAGGGSNATRIAGTDRYDTSVKIQQMLYNNYPPDAGTFGPPIDPEPVEYSNVVIGFARSEGAGPRHVGYPDALASAWLLDTQADQSTPPKRLAVPIEQNNDTIAADKTMTFTTVGGTAGVRRASLLLVPQTGVPAPVTAQLQAMFPDAGRNTTAAGAKTAASQGGFGFIFGGEGAVSQNSVLAIAQFLSGGFYTAGPNRSDLATKLDTSKVFYTAMSFAGYATTDQGGVDSESFIAAGDKVCALRNAAGGAQHLALYQVGGFGNAGIVDYQDNADSWKQFESRFICVDAANVSSRRTSALAIGPTGHNSSIKALDWSASDSTLIVDPPVVVDKASTITTGGGLTDEQTSPLGGGSSATATGTWNGTMDATYKGTTYNSAPFTLSVNFTRHDPDAGQFAQFPGDGSINDHITYTGTLTVRTEAGALVFAANLQGESSTIEASPYKMAGMYNTGTGAGGMRFTIESADGTTMRLSDFVLDGTG